MDYICGLIPARIRRALAELPETLDETYQRVLREIKTAEWELAHRLFQFVAVASRPLRVEELAVLLALDIEAGPIPKSHADPRLEDPVDAVLSTCSSLLAIVDGGENFGKVVQFSHPSVKEFLTSTRLAKASDIILHRYHISMTSAHTLAAQACLGILLQLDKDVVTRDSLKELPLAEYATEYWADHALLEYVSRNVEDGMKQLFDPSKSHFAVCIWTRDPAANRWERKPRAERPLPIPRTPLHYAAHWGLLSIVEFLVIEHAQDVHSQGFTDPDKATPLHLASEKGHVEVARFLLEHGAGVTARNKFGDTPLHLAKQVEVADLLIKHGAGVTAQDEGGFTPLHQASLVEVAGILIEHSADVTAQTEFKSTPLHQASCTGKVELAGILIERGADVTAKDDFWNTPLHLASQSGQLEVVGMLIERGADVTAQDKDGATPLHLASQLGHREVVGMLIEHGANVTAQNACGETPLHHAGHVKVVDLLIERGADPTAQTPDGDTPLHLAFKWGKLDPVGMLIERGADLTVQNKDGDTPLHLASQDGHMEEARMLIERGADVTTRNKDGDTPLHLASQEGVKEVAGLLIERGADVTAQNKDGKTPLHRVSTRRTRPHWQDWDEQDDTLTESWDMSTGSQEYLDDMSQEDSDDDMSTGSQEDSDDDMSSGLQDDSDDMSSPQEHAELARMLLEHGADVTVRDKDGRTPFDLASSDSGYEEVVHVLLEHGAVPGTQENMD